MNEGEADFVNLFNGPALLFELRDRLRFLSFFAEVGVVELEENPLGPLNVAGVGGVDFTVPVIGKAESLKLAAEVVHIGLGGDAGVLTGFDGILLGRESKGVPTHGVEHVEAIHALVATDDVGGGIAFGMSYV